MGESRAPGVQDGSDRDAGAKMPGIGGDGDQRLSRCLEEDVIDRRLVLIGDVGDWRGQREHHMIIRHRQQLGLAFGQPLPGCRGLALGTMPVAAGVVGDERVCAVITARDMPAENRRAAVLDSRHHLQLAEAQVTGVMFAPGSTMLAENIRDLQDGTGHKRPALLRRRRGLQMKVLKRTHDLPDRPGGNAGVDRCRLELGVSERSRVIMHILLTH